jgi:F0F1-type ATP synthase assembly protein I
MRDVRTLALGCGLATQLTITLVVTTLLPLLLGIWLDRQFNTSPFITLFMTLVGITLGTVAVSRNVTSVYKRVGGKKP